MESLLKFIIVELRDGTIQEEARQTRAVCIASFFLNRPTAQFGCNVPVYCLDRLPRLLTQPPESAIGAIHLCQGTSRKFTKIRKFSDALCPLTVILDLSIVLSVNCRV